MNRILCVTIGVVISVMAVHVVYCEEDQKSTVVSIEGGLLPLIWNDVPRFPDSTLTDQELKKSHPQYKSMEIKTYLTEIDPKRIDTFYQTKMEKYLWKKTSAYELNGKYHSAWEKNDQDLRLWIKVSETKKGKTEIEFIRVEGKR
jgi:hypothetical protein